MLQHFIIFIPIPISTIFSGIGPNRFKFPQIFSRTFYTGSPTLQRLVCGFQRDADRNFFQPSCKASSFPLPQALSRITTATSTSLIGLFLPSMTLPKTYTEIYLLPKTSLNSPRTSKAFSALLWLYSFPKYLVVILASSSRPKYSAYFS